jgi:hypothetical protein
MEFPTDKALKTYLKEHPHADPSRHTVKETERETAEPKAPTTGLFDRKLLADLPEGVGVKQKVQSPDKLFDQAKEAHEHQVKWLKGLDKEIGATIVRGDRGDKPDFKKPGVVVVIGKLKDRDRCEEKVKTDYKGDWSSLRDVVRSAVAVDKLDQLPTVIHGLKRIGLKLAREPKDRFQTPTDGGYRDISMNVVHPNGHVGELQLHLKPLLAAKKKGDEFYRDIRTIKAKARKEGREDLTPEEEAMVNEANAKMRRVFDKVWNEAGNIKTAMVARVIERAIVKPKMTEVRYYDLDGAPVIWKPGKFPKVEGGGVVYDLERVSMDATPITKAQFEKLVRSHK